MLTSIPLSAVESVRLTCRHCGVAIIMPTGTREVPGKCFNCCHEFPAQTIIQFMREMRFMKDTAERADVSFMVHLEVSKQGG